MAALGVVFAISRHTSHRKVAVIGKEADDANSVRWRR
jgi:hypothetical protein